MTGKIAIVTGAVSCSSLLLDDLAEAYFQLARPHRSAWTQNLHLQSWKERS